MTEEEISPVIRELRGFERYWYRFKWFFKARYYRWIPSIVWPGQQIDVLVTFSANKLPRDLSFSDQDGPGDALSHLFSGQIYEIEKQLAAAGVTFDKGLGFEGRDWEWDFSLRGPISVKFKTHATKPELRQEKPRPKLIFSRGDAA